MALGWILILPLASDGMKKDGNFFFFFFTAPFKLALNTLQSSSWLKLMVLFLPQPLGYWDYRHALTYPAERWKHLSTLACLPSIHLSGWMGRDPDTRSLARSKH